MLDITLIREKPEWVKAQIEKLNDPGALERIDAIVALDQQRRTALTKVEALKANRNKLNKAFGIFRGNKTLTDPQRIATAVEVAAALADADIEAALALLEAPVEHTDRPAPGDANAAFAALQQSMGALGTTVGALDEQVKAIDAELNEHMLWLPNLPHESVPVGLSEDENVPCEAHGTIPHSTSSRRPTGTSARRWASSTSSAASSWPGRASTS